MPWKVVDVQGEGATYGVFGLPAFDADHGLGRTLRAEAKLHEPGAEPALAAAGPLMSLIITSHVPTMPELPAAKAVIGLSATAPMPTAPAEAPIKSCRRLSSWLDIAPPY